MVTKLSHCARLLVLKLAFETAKQKLLLQTDTHTHTTVWFLPGTAMMHMILSHILQSSQNGVPLDLLLNQSSDTNRLHQHWLLPKLWALRLVENIRHTVDQCMQNYYYYYYPWERFRISTTHNNLAHQCCNSNYYYCCSTWEVECKVDVISHFATMGVNDSQPTCCRSAPLSSLSLSL